MKPTPIEHELAHALADVATEAGEHELAVELLERAQRVEGGPVGFYASLRTANRLLNIRERLARDCWDPDVRCPNHDCEVGP